MHRRFYKWTDGKTEVISMDYKQKIIALLDKVNNEAILKRVYNLLQYLYLKED